MSRRSTIALAIAARLAPALAVAAIGAGAGYATVDGYEATYVDPPPPAVVYEPTYSFHDGYIDESRGRYYHMHRGRWVTYRTLPREAVRVRVEGRAMRQGR